VVEEFVCLGSFVHPTTHKLYDTSLWNVISRALRVAMQNLDNQVQKSTISVSTKLKLYNTCILPIFLYGSECYQERCTKD